MSTRGAGAWRAIVVLTAVVVLAVAGHLFVRWFTGLLEIEIRPVNEPIVHRMLMTAAAVYTLLLAVPFVPGVEIGFSLIMLFGPKILFLLYLCTFGGLTLAFVVGRLIPPPAIRRALARLGLGRAAAFVARVEGLDTEARLALLVSRAPSRLVPFLVRYRYLALGLAFNVPGNALIGGGGGIALMAGMSRLFPVPAYLATVAVAISPVPLAVWLFGTAALA